MGVTVSAQNGTTGWRDQLALDCIPAGGAVQTVEVQTRVLSEASSRGGSRL